MKPALSYLRQPAASFRSSQLRLSLPYPRKSAASFGPAS